MKKLLQIIFWTIIAALTSITLVSCEKPDNEPLEPAKPASPTWYLTFSAPCLNYSCVDLPVQAIMNNMGNDNVVVGLTLDFEDERFKCRIFTEGNDNHVVQWTGVCDGHAFLVQFNEKNVCGGIQNSPITYKLTLK